MRKKEPPRVVGPYRERRGWRVVVVDDDGRKAVCAATREEALRLKEQFARELITWPTRTIRQQITTHIAERQASGVSLPSTVTAASQRLFSFFAEVLALGTAQLTPRQAEALYVAATQRVTRHGRTVSVATHRAELGAAKRFCAWAQRRGFVAANPFDLVEPRGRVNAGKKQLRIDEARAFTDTGLRLWRQNGDVLALAAVSVLLMGLRASELLNRTVRDLDDRGALLVIEAGKNKNARRSPKVPQALRPHLLALAQGRQAEAWLFQGSKGQQLCRTTLRSKVGQICRLAGVPVVCTHALRGCYASFAVGAGVTSEQVARSLGHASFEVTRRHYATADAIGDAHSAALAQLLTRPSLEAVLAEVSAEELLRSLPPTTLSELVALRSVG